MANNFKHWHKSLFIYIVFNQEHMYIQDIGIQAQGNGIGVYKIQTTSNISKVSAAEDPHKSCSPGNSIRSLIQSPAGGAPYTNRACSWLLMLYYLK